MSRLSVLPLDVVANTFQFLDPHEITDAAARVSKRFLVVSRLDATWLHIQIAMELPLFLNIQQFLAVHGAPLPHTGGDAVVSSARSSLSPPLLSAVLSRLESIQDLDQFVMPSDSAKARLTKRWAAMVRWRHVSASLPAMARAVASYLDFLSAGAFTDLIGPQEGAADGDDGHHRPGDKRARGPSPVDPTVTRLLLGPTLDTLRPGFYASDLLRRFGPSGTGDNDRNDEADESDDGELGDAAFVSAERLLGDMAQLRVPAGLLSLLSLVGGMRAFDNDVAPALAAADRRRQGAAAAAIRALPEQDRPHGSDVRGMFNGFFGNANFYDQVDARMLVSPELALALMRRSPVTEDRRRCFPFGLGPQSQILGVLLEPRVAPTALALEPAIPGDSGDGSVVFPRGSVVQMRADGRPNSLFLLDTSFERFFFGIVAGVRPTATVGRQTRTVDPPPSSRAPVARAGGARATAMAAETTTVVVRPPRYSIDREFGGVAANPLRGGGASRAVTHGVEVVASPYFVLGGRSVRGASYNWAYQLSMRFLRTAAANPGPTCQLQSRRWFIRDLGRPHDPEEVIEGPGVVGLFPILVVSGDGISTDDDAHRLFRYSSCTGFKSSHGVMRGTLTFVPGTAAHPLGPPFEVEVAPFHCHYAERPLLRAHARREAARGAAASAATSVEGDESSGGEANSDDDEIVF